MNTVVDVPEWAKRDIKLFETFQSASAYFGEKGYQQILMIERMVDDLVLPARDADGLAPSYRNAI